MFKCFFEEPEANSVKQELEELNRIPVTSSLIPYLQILDDNKTVITKNHTLLRVIELEGFDNISTSFDEISDLFLIRKNMFNNLSSDLELSFFTFKKRSANTDTQSSDNILINKINSLREKDFDDSYDISLFVVVNKKHNFSKFNLGKYNLNLNRAKNEFSSEIDRIKANLQPYNPKELNNVSKSNFELSRFFTYLLYNKQIPIRSKDELYKKYALRDLEFIKKDGIINLENRYCKIINVNVDIKDSKEIFFKSLLSLDLEFDIACNVVLKEKTIVDQEIDKRLKFNSRLGSAFATGIRDEDLETAKELVENELITMLSFSCYIKIFADTKEEVNQAADFLSNHFSNIGIAVIPENINLKWAYLSFLSDYSYADQRKIPLNSENLSDFIPLFNSYKGESKNSFGNSPVARFKNISNLSYNFNFHKDPSPKALGHSFVIGGTGAGKSTLIAFLLMNCLKYQNIKILAFDSNEGLKVPFTMFDGNYSNVSNPHEVVLNPFSLKENLVNRDFLVKFLTILAGGADLNEKAILEEVVRQNYDSLGNKGTLGKLEMVFGIKKQHNNQPNIAKRLEKWIKDKDLSRYFNNEKDNLIFDKKINCFDIGSNILDNPTILNPLNQYIFHRFDNLLNENPAPNIILIDEFQKYARVKDFASNIIYRLEEQRKKNGILIGCTQQPSTLLKSSYIDKDKFLSNIGTLILFPNSRASEADYKELGLNDNEFAFIKTTENSASSRKALIKQTEGKSSIINIDLSSLGKYIHCFSSSAENVKLMEKLQESPDWINQFLKEAK